MTTSPEAISSSQQEEAPRTRPSNCPECGSSSLYRDGFRYSPLGSSIQRWLCRECGFRFSMSNSDPNNSKTDHSIEGNRQVCVILQEAKNLASATESKTVAGEQKQDIDFKGLMTVYMAKAVQNGMAEATITRNVENLTWISKNAVFNDPLNVWDAIDRNKKWKPGTKQITASAYKNFCKLFKKPLPEDLNFNKWTIYERIPYIPLETDILQLISGSNYQTAALLQLLYETGMRSGEAWRVRWTDFDFEKKILTLQGDIVEKKGRPRQFKLSDKLIAMIKRIPRERETVWPGTQLTLMHLRQSYYNQRKRLAAKLENPNIAKITLHTFRHFYASKLYHNTKDILLVKERLGHRNIKNTMVYTSLVEWEEADQYTVRRPGTTKEEDQLIESGFEYVRYDDKLDVPIYRKRK